LSINPENKAELHKILAAGEAHWRKRWEEEENPPLRDVIWTYMDGDKWGGLA
jgi:hypothetical protein